MNKKEMEDYGYCFARGVFKYFALVFTISLAILLIYGSLRGIDSSDISYFNRSGLKVHTDQLTGVQYLSVAGGGITPRLDADGQMMFERREYE